MFKVNKLVAGIICSPTPRAKEDPSRSYATKMMEAKVNKQLIEDVRDTRKVLERSNIVQNCKFREALEVIKTANKCKNLVRDLLLA